ncbi:MAG: hypothetical protein M1826_007005 [Phylliscum demangeonii]|nr:MAG: hypothetical protein M1826_007005 [Phylliscum demangeonii]
MLVPSSHTAFVRRWPSALPLPLPRLSMGAGAARRWTSSRVMDRSAGLGRPWRPMPPLLGVVVPGRLAMVATRRRYATSTSTSTTTTTTTPVAAAETTANPARARARKTTTGKKKVTVTKRTTATATKRATPARARARATKKKARKPGAKTRTRARTRAGKTKPKKGGRLRTRVPLTEEQKVARKRKEQVQRAVSKNLTIPKQLPQTAFGVVNQEVSKEKRGLDALEASRRYAALSPEQVKDYTRVGNENKAANGAAYKKWVESHTVEEIQLANRARKRLRFLSKMAGVKVPGGSRVRIRDVRVEAKRPRSGYVHFVMSRHASGKYKDRPMLVAAGVIAQEWKAMPAEEKRPYQRMFEDEKARLQLHQPQRAGPDLAKLGTPPVTASAMT